MNFSGLNQPYLAPNMMEFCNLTKNCAERMFFDINNQIWDKNILFLQTVVLCFFTNWIYQIALKKDLHQNEKQKTLFLAIFFINTVISGFTLVWSMGLLVQL